MSNANDFIIENGVLKRYNGTDEHVKIPEDVIGIGYSAFCNCNAITSVIIGDGVTYIDDEAFKNCENLTSVDIPNQVTSIGKFAFMGCSLTHITIPDSVTSVGEHAFAFCSSLTQIAYQGTMQQWEQVRFGEQTDCPLKRIQCIDGVVELNL